MTRELDGNPAATTPLSGTEQIPAIQSGADVNLTPLDIAALGTVVDATSTTKGKLKLAGDLAGVGSSADAPKVLGLDETVRLTGSQIVAGLKTFTTGIAVPVNTLNSNWVNGLDPALAARPLTTEVVLDTGDQTVAGVKTFSDPPVVPDGSWAIADTWGLQTALNAKALDSAVVHNTGAEAVAGVKTFSSAPVVPAASWSISSTSGLQAALDALHNTQTANTRTASYVLVLTDAGKVIEMDVAGANTLTIPPNSSVPFPVGTVLSFYEKGAGQTTITPGVGVTLRSNGGKLKLAGQYAVGAARQVAIDEWSISGDLSV
jgi:hypothetical protein